MGTPGWNPYTPRQSQNATRFERFADAITTFCGNIWFIIFHAIWFGWWVVHNLAYPSSFDPYPFGLLTMIVSLEAIILSSFILLSQRREGITSQRHAEYDLSVNVRTEAHAKEILRLLREINERRQSSGRDNNPRR
ncbi:MAG: DUF1003 domain-containing protein [Nanoarchaeota archaeon]